MFDDINNKSAYCLGCKNPLCRPGCPADIDIPTFIRYIKENNYEQAYETILESSLLPGFCGLLCPHEKQCEGHCVRAKKGNGVEIGSLEAFVANHFHNRITFKGNFTDCSVGIVGGGIAGMSCAFELARNGAHVTIFEKEAALGGAVRQYIPRFRFDDYLLEHLRQNLLDLNVRIEYNKVLGVNLHYQDLAGFDACFVAIGSSLSNTLSLTNEEVNGIYQAYDLLEQAKKNELNLSSRKVLVIGAGNVAMDVARLLKRAGNDVTIVYRRTFESSPASRHEINDAIRDGVMLEELASPIKALVTDGKITGLLTQVMEQSDPGADGRRQVIPHGDETKIFDGDTIVLALGNYSDYSVLKEFPGLEVASNKTIIVSEQLETSIPNLYVGGDFFTGPKTIVSAMVAGRTVARDIINKF
jgi:glutamate synthase (NADPH/NADH) small chain